MFCSVQVTVTPSEIVGTSAPNPHQHGMSMHTVANARKRASATQLHSDLDLRRPMDSAVAGAAVTASAAEAGNEAARSSSDLPLSRAEKCASAVGQSSFADDSGDKPGLDSSAVLLLSSAPVAARIAQPSTSVMASDDSHSSGQPDAELSADHVRLVCACTVLVWHCV